MAGAVRSLNRGGQATYRGRRLSIRQGKDFRCEKRRTAYPRRHAPSDSRARGDFSRRNPARGLGALDGALARSGGHVPRGLDPAAVRRTGREHARGRTVSDTGGLSARILSGTTHRLVRGSAPMC